MAGKSQQLTWRYLTLALAFSGDPRTTDTYRKTAMAVVHKKEATEEYDVITLCTWHSVDGWPSSVSAASPANTPTRLKVAVKRSQTLR